MSRRRLPVVLGLVLAVAVGVSVPRIGGWLGGEDDGAIVVTAEFEDTTGVYVGNDVTYLGVRVGEIVDVEPRGTTMRVVMHLDPDTQVPEDAGAEILQSSLVTDRYIELGPAYEGGPTLADGDHIPTSHTRAPATVDEVAKAVDDLVLALNAGLGEGGGGHDLGQALSTAANALHGNGTYLRRALAHGQDALAVLNSKDADITAVTDNLTQLVDVLSRRDRMIRTFTRSAADTTGVLADQRTELVQTLDSLDTLTRQADRFLRRNGDVLTDDLSGMADLVSVVRAHEASLSEAFDVMPTMAENFARAYDWKLGRLRVQFAFSAGPFAAAFRSHSCQVFLATLTDLGSRLCDALFTPQGTGALDPLLDGVYDSLPGAFP
ncbi:MAG TPA: MCE family protein [Nocardioides sp.]|nr:MCE family protein [Nocardioides sp.]